MARRSITDLSEVAGAIKPLFTLHVELDERAFLFPHDKPTSHLVLTARAADRIDIDATFPFNKTHEDTTIQSLGQDDARQFSRAILDAYSQGPTQHVFSDRVKIAIVFNANGFLISFEREDAPSELFVSPSSILRVARGLLNVLDEIGPNVAH